MSRILRYSAILSAGILIGRFSGYIRELVIAGRYGASGDADVIILLLSLPDLINNLLAAASVGAVMIPILTERGEEVAMIVQQFLYQLLRLAFLAVAIVVGGSYFLYSTDPDVFWPITVSYLSIFPNAVTAVLISYLQFRHRFLFPSLGTLVFNLAFVAALLFTENRLFLAGGVVIAAIVRLLFIAIDVSATGLRPSQLRPRQAPARLPAQVVIIALVSGGLLYIAPVLDRIYASFLEPGSVAALSYAEKIYLLPVSVFLTTYAIAMFPELSTLIGQRDGERARSVLARALGVNLVLSLVIATGVFLFRSSIVHLLYGSVGLGADAQDRVTSVLAAYSGALFIAGTNAILINTLYALRKPQWALIYSVLFIGVKVAVNWWILAGGYTVVSIAGSTSSLLIAATAILGGIVFSCLPSGSIQTVDTSPVQECKGI